MKDVYEKMISTIIRNMNWSRIKHFHHLLDLKWQFQDNKGNIVERFPTITELKDELKTLIKFAMIEKEKSIETGNWLIKWDFIEEENKTPNFTLEVFFVLEDAISIETNIKDYSKDSLPKLEDQLKSAVDSENFEEAAKIRDIISSLNEK